MNDRIYKIIACLEGTCIQTYEEACRDCGVSEAALTKEEQDILDAAIFCCSCCGWWYDIGELDDDNEEYRCIHCKEE